MESKTFMSEAAGLILLRIIAKRKFDGIIDIFCLNHEFNVCPMSYVPVGLSLKYLQDLYYKTFVIEGQIKLGTDETISCESYYNKDGLLMFYIQDGCPVYFLFPKPTLKADSPFALNLRKKEGVRYLYTLERKVVEDISFNESNCVLMKTGNGSLSISAEKTFYKDEMCILVHMDMVIQTKAGWVSSTIVSYMNMHLETMEYIEHQYTRKRNWNKQKIIIISASDWDHVRMDKTIVEDKKVHRKTEYFTEQQFYGFLSKATIILLQRILVRTDFKEQLHFITLSDDDKISTLIFCPAEADISNHCYDGKLFAIETSIIPECGTITTWKNVFNAEGYLLKGFYYGQTFSTEYCKDSHVFHKLKMPDVCAYSRTYASAQEFLQSIGRKDLRMVSFADEMDILKGDSVIGHLSISVEDLLNSEGFIVIYISAEMQIGEVKCSTNIKGKLDYSLTVLEQCMQESVEVSEELAFATDTTIKFDGTSSYEISRSTPGSRPRIKYVAPPHGVPFICEASAILVERLMVRKNVTDSFEFFSLNGALLNCKIRYHVIGKDWKIISGKKVEIIQIERNLIMSDPANCLRWKLSFSKFGKYVERKQTNVPARMQMKLPNAEDNAFYQILPEAVASHEPAFARSISLQEVEKLLFMENLSVIIEIGEEMNEIGSYFSTVDHVVYNGMDALLVQVSQTTEMHDCMCGTRITGYINFNLEIIHFKKIEYFIIGSKRTETLLLFAKEFETYHLQYIESCDNVVTTVSKKWALPVKELFICEASAILIQRLMVARKTSDTLRFISFETSGNACIVNFIPKGVSCMSAGRNIFDIVTINYVVTYSDGSTINIEKKLTRSGFAVSHIQDNVQAKVVHMFSQKREKSTDIKYNIPEQSLDETETEISQDRMAYKPKSVPIDIDCLQQILGRRDMLKVMTRTNKEVGSFCFYANNMQSQYFHGILAQLEVNVNDSGNEISAFSIDLLSLDFQVVNHVHVYTVETTDLFMQKRLSVQKHPLGFIVKHAVKSDKGAEKNSSFTLMMKENVPFVSEASCMLFQKVFAKSSLVDMFKFFYIDIDRNICDVILNSFGTCEGNSDNLNANFHGMAIDIIPRKKCSSFCRTYFDSDGSLVYCDLVGSPFIAACEDIAEKSLKLQKLSYENTLKFLKSIDPSDYESNLFPDYAHIVSSGQLIGAYSAVLDTTVVKGISCISICICSFVCKTKAKSMTTTHAMVKPDLEIVNYVFHECVDAADHPWDEKTVVTRGGSEYKVETLCCKDRATEKHSKTIQVEDASPLYCEAICILLLRLMIKKEANDEMNFKCIDKSGDIGSTKVKCLGLNPVTLSGIKMKAWKFRSTTTCSDGQQTTWEYNMTENGNLLSRQQIGTPCLIVVPREVCQRYAAQKSAGMTTPVIQELPDMEQSKHLKQASPEIKAAFSEFYNFVSNNKPADLLHAAKVFFSKYPHHST